MAIVTFDKALHYQFISVRKICESHSNPYIIKYCALFEYL